ncbi:MAG: hypothetical protein ACI8TQ_000329 [Planctomycetota bacterium]|jgi:hypothetical protein
MSNPSSELPPRSPLALVLLCAIIAWSACFAIFVVAQKCWIDDSFISFRYARNFVADHGLVFNAGDPVEGYTNFLWTIVTSIGLSLGFVAMPFAQAMGLVAQAVTLWCVYEIGRGAGHRGLRPLIAPFFLGTSFAFLAYPMTGMETSFFTMLLTIGFLAMQRKVYQRTVGGVLLGVSLFALGTARFDGFGPVILLLSYPLFFGGKARSFKSFLAPVGVFLVAMLAYNLWRVSFYPTGLPNTFHAKTTFSFDRVLIGLDYLKEFYLGKDGEQGEGLVVFSLALLPFLALRAGSTARFLGWVVLGQIGYVAIVGGDWMFHYRFLMHVLPLMFLLMAEALILIGDAAAKHIPAPRVFGALGVILLVWLQSLPFEKHLEFEEIEGPFFKPHDAELIGKYLQANYPPEPLVAIEWGGIIPNDIENEVLDTWGLTDHEFASHPDLFKTVWGTVVGPRLLAGRKPKLIACNARLLPTEAEARKSVLPGGPNHYRFYPQMATPEMGFEWKFFEVAPNAWWPALVAIQ